jgi:hypothetical protein
MDHDDLEKGKKFVVFETGRTRDVKDTDNIYPRARVVIVALDLDRVQVEVVAGRRM